MRKTWYLIAIAFLQMLAAAPAFSQQVWIDVRTIEEYNTDHISGDTNIPLATLDADALATRYGKDAQIMLYCRSGNRAGQAETLLEAAGFTNVTNAGGIADVRERRDLTASQSSSAQSARSQSSPSE